MLTFFGNYQPEKTIFVEERFKQKKVWHKGQNSRQFSGLQIQ